VNRGAVVGSCRCQRLRQPLACLADSQIFPRRWQLWLLGDYRCTAWPWSILCTRPREEPTVIEATRSRLNRAEYAAMLAPWPVRVPSDIATVSTVSRGNELSSWILSMRPPTGTTTPTCHASHGTCASRWNNKGWRCYGLTRWLDAAPAP